MNSTLLPPPNDDDLTDVNHALSHDTGKKISPAHTGKGRNLDIPGASTDLLEELRRKTAELAKQVPGEESWQQRTLKVQADKKPQDLIDQIKQKEKDGAPEMLSHSKRAVVPNPDPAVNLVRDKLARIYKDEPDAAQEVIEAQQAGTQRTKHQQFMYGLTTSGQSLADIQTNWHNYYISLPEDEKHEVWQEFYTAHDGKETSKASTHNSALKYTSTSETAKAPRAGSDRRHVQMPPRPESRTARHIKDQVLDKVNAGGQLTAVHHAKSLLFGAAMSAFVLLLITFVFFNDAYIAPFVSPNQTVSATPIIGAQTGAVGPEPKIIIPKINLEVPVVFDLETVNEAQIQSALEDGVVHYANSPNPGENGNSVIVGHSSNNIFNSGKYKFAFVLLKRLETDDTFFVHRDGVRYTYKIYKKEVVKPNNLSVLRTQDRPNTMTLITCDPPGTSLNRLIITAEQISPDPSSNTSYVAPTIESGTADATLPSNAPSLWSRLWPF